VDDNKGLINLVIVAVVIVGSILMPLIERWRRRRLLEEGKPPEGPEPKEPKLPYEDLVDEIFGPYMERRRKKHEEEAAAAAPPPPPRRVPEPEPVIRIIEETPAPSRLEESKAPPAAVMRVRSSPSLDERLFRNPRLSPAARLVLAAEIMRPPKALRPRR
jgi:hypothetical protein